eukprot:CAMPEP_0167760214 /NCGR_PEP_ID=MMETSP0110_2-20121227/11463_1 /TAXON_ID=629695 /ORGANISM="Gymnochlora sp., Strain CCMP2014" /LENGTH=439 /DNA_ID=CAMNT_0007646703 /DNA_START=138 /DNA_END=1457 /DNA_ORIENTATION=+
MPPRMASRRNVKVYDSLDELQPKGKGQSAMESLQSMLGDDSKSKVLEVEDDPTMNQKSKRLSALDTLTALLPEDPTPAPTPAPTIARQDAFTGLIIPGKIVQEAMKLKSVSEVASALDTYIKADDTKSALRLAAQCRKSRGGALQNFGSRHIVVPKKDYDLDELIRNNINTTAFVTPVDDTLDDIRLGGSISAFAGIVALSLANHWGIGQALFCVFGIFALSAYDTINNNSGGNLLIVDTIGRAIFPQYRKRVAVHEAGHFMVSYLMGVLPVDYTLSAYDAYQKRGESRGLRSAVQAGTRFADELFKQEIATGSIRARSLDQFTCISLAGIASELVVLDRAEGGRSDLVQLDALLFALRFSPQRAAFQVRWSVFNTVSLLREHRDVLVELADAMEEGKSVAQCIQLLEEKIPPPPPEEYDENGHLANKSLYDNSTDTSS